MKTVKVLIPYHKQKEKLEDCLRHLKASLFADYTVEIQDDSESENGFTKTVNTLVKKALVENPDYLLVVNQDCYLKPEALGELVSFMETKPQAFMCGVKQLDNENQDFITHGGTRECFPTGVHCVGLVSKNHYNEPKKVPWVNGACFIVRASLIPDVGLMDPNYKMFGSDADWGYSARLRGFDCWYNPKAVVVHESSGSSRKMDKSMEKTFESDMRYFRDKWLVGECYRDLSLELFE